MFSPIQGFWCRPDFIPNVISFQKHFQALDDDIIVATKPKAGTTWVKALVFTIVNRTRYSSLSDSPLNSANPHQLVPFFELNLYTNGQIPDLSSTSPRLFATHLPYSAIPDSTKQSNCRIVYVTRNPLDVVVSYWHFTRNMPRYSDWRFEDCIETFCRGEDSFGPFWDHVLGYWKESLERPNKVLFLRYEDLKKDPILQIKRIADFLGFPFTGEEERGGVIEEISKFCSFSNLKDLEVNKNGKLGWSQTQNKTFFRKGEVGDYINHLSPAAIERLSKTLEEKLSGSGLTFDL